MSCKETELRKRRDSRREKNLKERKPGRSAVRVAQIDAALRPFVLERFAFLAFIFGDFLFGVRKRLAGGKHGGGLGGCFPLCAKLPKFGAHLANRRPARFSFHRQLAALLP